MTRSTRTTRQAPPTTRGASSSRFRRGAAGIREAAGDAAPVYRHRVAGRHPLNDPVFAAYFVHGFGAFCPRCWSTSIGWDGCLSQWEEDRDPVCHACRPVCESCWHPDPWADPEHHVHAAAVPMLTLYTAGLAERPQHGDERFAVLAELARTAG